MVGNWPWMPIAMFLLTCEELRYSKWVVDGLGPPFFIMERSKTA